MMHIGIDIEQFVTDPYGSGIQRVLQYLAKEWPQDVATAEFVVPFRDEYLLLSPEQAGGLIELAFEQHSARDIRQRVTDHVAQLADECAHVRLGTAISMFSAWLLPEVSYLPTVLERFAIFAQCMPTVMIGYDALPMTDPANYRFRPGSAGFASQYFRSLATADAVVCISDYSRRALLGRLRRDSRLTTAVAHPGGDHISVREPGSHPTGSKVAFLRLGTMESRKKPIEILEAFRTAHSSGSNCELTFVGKPSASNLDINHAVRSAASTSEGVRWVEDASDEHVREILQQSDVFLSIGTEGYGIPVLEALRLGVPVLYAGIQPAAELMDGLGAARMSGTDLADLVEMFRNYGDDSSLNELRSTIDPDRVPKWQEFTTSVAAVASQV